MKDDRIKTLEEIKRGNATHDCPTCDEPTYCAMFAGKSSSTCWCMSEPINDSLSVRYIYESCQCKVCLNRGE